VKVAFDNVDGVRELFDVNYFLLNILNKSNFEIFIYGNFKQIL